MAYRHGDKLLIWASDLEPDTLAQAERTARLPFVAGHVALMADAHLGMGATVGSVIPTDGAIIPAAVGVDIGCGMIAVETGITSAALPDDLTRLLHRLERVIPAGVGKGHSASSPGRAWLEAHPNRSVTEGKLEKRAAAQFGSLGAGNHFVEVCLDPGDTVWLVLHSGSRGVGNKLAMHHIEVAKGSLREHLAALGDPDLAYLTEGSRAFDRYITDLLWAQDYARANRARMMDALLAALDRELRRGGSAERVTERRRIQCHHNYTARERHRGRELWITRKGAIRAGVGDLGVIPGSMGTSSFIVRGLGNPDAFESSAHGAGRRMSRRQAKKRFTAEQLTEQMAGKTWLADRPRALLDEIPSSYKDIHTVMRDQADLVEIETELTQILNYKGT
jgi:tRNA-splicing ligase RtcB